MLPRRRARTRLTDVYADCRVNGSRRFCKHSATLRASLTPYRINGTETALTSLRHAAVDDAIGGFLRNPSEESFVSVFQALYSRLCRYFMARGLDSPTSEELVQDVLMTVYRRSREVRNRDCFMGWLFRVARNSLLQNARKQHVVCESLSSNEHAGRLASLTTVGFRMREESDLFNWLQVLDEDEREICLMRYMDDLDYESIAGALQLPLGTVKWKLHQIKKKMAVRLGDAGTGRKS